MRKLFVAVLAVGLVFAMRAQSFAAFTSVSASSVTASITFTGLGSVNMGITWSAGSAFTWASPVPTIGTTTWQVADQYIILASTITQSTGGIQIYTDNYHAIVSTERYTGAAANAAGLVCLSSTTQTLPMCWRVVAVSTGTQTIVAGTDGKLYLTQEGGQAGQYPCFLWMTDKGNTGWYNGESYAEIKDGTFGLQTAEATWSTGVPSPVCVYVGANFATATTSAGGTTYKTTTLRLEAFYD